MCHAHVGLISHTRTLHHKGNWSSLSEKMVDDDDDDNDIKTIQDQQGADV